MILYFKFYYQMQLYHIIEVLYISNNGRVSLRKSWRHGKCFDLEISQNLDLSILLMLGILGNFVFSENGGPLAENTDTLKLKNKNILLYDLRYFQRFSLQFRRNCRIHPRTYLYLRIRWLGAQIPRRIAQTLTYCVDTNKCTGVQEILAGNITAALRIYLRPFAVGIAR